MKQTLGSKVVELSKKTPTRADPIELQRVMQENYMADLLQAVDRGYKRFVDDFFIHVETKKEPLLPNTFRNYFIDRKTCPTPNYDQSVFRYDRQKGELEYLWTIPDRQTCFNLAQNANIVEEKELLECVIKFANGSLFKLCKKLNNEKADSTHLRQGFGGQA